MGIQRDTVTIIYYLSISPKRVCWTIPRFRKSLRIDLTKPENESQANDNPVSLETMA